MPSRTVAIFSTKGGVGKTLIATNLAVALGHEAHKKVAIIDLDLQAIGDMTKLLNITPTRSLLDLSEKLKTNPDGTALKDFLVHVPQYGVDFLPAVLNPRQAAHVNAERIRTVLIRLEKEYDFIIVDAGRAFTESLFAVFNQTNLILLTVTPDVLSVYQTKWALDTLQSLHIPLNMIYLILNRAQSIGGVSWQEVRAAVPCEIIARLPSEGKAVGLALNRRVPVMIDSPSCKVSQAIRKLQKDLLERKELYLEYKQIPHGPVDVDLLAKEGRLMADIGSLPSPIQTKA